MAASAEKDKRSSALFALKRRAATFVALCAALRAFPYAANLVQRGLTPRASS